MGIDADVDYVVTQIVVFLLASFLSFTTPRQQSTFSSYPPSRPPHTIVIVCSQVACAWLRAPKWRLILDFVCKLGAGCADRQVGCCSGILVCSDSEAGRGRVVRFPWACIHSRGSTCRVRAHGYHSDQCLFLIHLLSGMAAVSPIFSGEEDQKLWNSCSAVVR